MFGEQAPGEPGRALSVVERLGRRQQRQVLVFALMGLMAAFAGITTARLAAGSPSAGSLQELDAIASCVIGGTSLRGGSGTVFGALIGALIMASLDNGMSMLGVDMSGR